MLPYSQMHSITSNIKHVCAEEVNKLRFPWFLRGVVLHLRWTSRTMSSNNRPQKGQHLNTRFFMATLRPPKLMQVCNMSPCTPLTELCSIQVSGNWLAIKALLQFCILLDHTSVPASSLTEAVRYKDESINRHLAKCLCAQSNHSHSYLWVPV